MGTVKIYFDKMDSYCLICPFVVCWYAILLQVVHPYQADSDVELSLLVGDYVVVRKVYNLLDLNVFVILNKIDFD